jgi:hypothetical protein
VPLVTGILPSAVTLGLFDPAYAKQRHERFLHILQQSGASPEALVKAFPDGVEDQHLEVLAAFIKEQFDREPGDYHSAEIDFEQLFGMTEAELLGYHGWLRFKRQRPQKPRRLTC